MKPEKPAQPLTIADADDQSRGVVRGRVPDVGGRERLLRRGVAGRAVTAGTSMGASAGWPDGAPEHAATDAPT